MECIVIFVVIIIKADKVNMKLMEKKMLFCLMTDNKCYAIKKEPFICVACRAFISWVCGQMYAAILSQQMEVLGIVGFTAFEVS
jgi:hypothetical protein